MKKMFLKSSTKKEKYPNGGDESYWMGRIAKSMSPMLDSLEILCQRGEGGEEPAQGCGLLLSLGSHAAPEEIEGKIKGAEVFYYKYSPAGKRAAEVTAARLKQAYPQPELVEVVATAAQAELSSAKVPAVTVKLGYHDNPQDEAWLVNNVEAIALALAKAVKDFLEGDGIED